MTVVQNFLRSVSAENPDGAPGGGARAAPQGELLVYAPDEPET